MIHKSIAVVLSLLTYLLITGCITTVDANLPYTDLPVITVATEVKLVASPSHPMAYLPVDKIAAGAKVKLLGTDQDAAWLLVLHNNTLGWMPAIFSRDNISKLKPALVLRPLSDKCSTYLGATSAPDELWTNPTDQSVLVLGSIYRVQNERPFEAASLAIQLTGKGTPVAADYVHLPLTPSTAVILFAFSINDLRKNSQLHFILDNPSQEPLTWQFTFFTNECPEEVGMAAGAWRDRLPVGMIKTTIPTTAPRITTTATTEEESTATRTPTPTITPTPTLVIIPVTSPPPTLIEGCPNTYPTRLAVGMRADVTTSPRLNVRREPTTGAKNVVGQVYPGETVTIRDGPRCAEEMIWWSVESESNLVGWVSEGSVQEYFMEPSSGTTPVAATRTPQSSSGDSQLEEALRRKSRTSGVALHYAAQAEAFINTLLRHLDEFQLANIGITRNTMTDALNRADTGDRINSVVQEVWADWQSNARARNFDAATADPGSRGFSPFRQLIIRLIQGRQDRLSDSQQHALYNYFTRSEDASVWRNDPDAVIGAINRESFRWP